MNRNQTSYRVALLAGGDSDERAISLQSGAAVQKALSERGHFVLHLDPALVDLAGLDWAQFDVAFIALHGRFGEDGQVQRLLESVGIPFTGSSSEASQLAFSKTAAKERFLQNAVPTPAYSLLHYSDDVDRIRRVTDEIGYPLVVKPDSQGSSLGVSIVHSPDQLFDALKSSFHFDSFAVIERAVLGSEWTVGLFDNLVLPAIKIETDREFFDWQAKYEDDSTRYLFDFNVPSVTLVRIEQAARDACQALGTSGLMRVDLRVDESLQPWVLEVNTIPGMTSHSLIPKAAERLGIKFGELCEMAIDSRIDSRVPQPHLFSPHNLPKSSLRQTSGD